MQLICLVATKHRIVSILLYNWLRPIYFSIMCCISCVYVCLLGWPKGSVAIFSKKEWSIFFLYKNLIRLFRIIMSVLRNITV